VLSLAGQPLNFFERFRTKNVGQRLKVTLKESGGKKNEGLRVDGVELALT
jgi:hypothetical protein